MRSLDKALRGMTLAAVTAVMAATCLPAQEVSTAADATVVTVGDARKSTRDATLWGLATRYVPSAQGKNSKELTGQESREIERYVLAIQLYHNALASSRNQGRPITERDLIFKGEKLYLPPQGVLDKIVGLMPNDPSQGVTAAKRDQLMHTVLSDVAENKDLIKGSKAGTNLTTEVLIAAGEVKDASETAQRNLTGDQPGSSGPASGTRSLIGGNLPTQELDDTAEPTDTTLLGPDGKPIDAGDVTVGQLAGDTGSGTGEKSSVDVLTGIDMATTQTNGLEQALAIAQGGAADATNPNRAKFKQLVTKIQAELARRKAEERKAKQQGKTGLAGKPRGTGTGTGADAADGTPTAGTGTAGLASTKPSTSTQQASSGSPSGPDAAGTEPNIEMEYVPDWYLKALQEWNLQQYWQTRSAKAEGSHHGKKKVLDPLTGKEKEVDDTEDPFSQFSDELTNVQQTTGQVEKRSDK